MGVLVGFLPWIASWILNSFELYIPGILIPLVMLARPVLRGQAKLLDKVSLVFFSILAIGVIGLQWRHFEHWSSAASNGTLALMAWGSILVGTPFTIEYARETVPEDVWHLPGFLYVNQVITAVWALSFSIQAVVALLATEQYLVGSADEIVSIACTVFAVMFTNRFPDAYTRRKKASPVA